MIAMPSRRTRALLSPARGPASAIASATTASADQRVGQPREPRAPRVAAARAARAATRTRRGPRRARDHQQRRHREQRREQEPRLRELDAEDQRHLAGHAAASRRSASASPRAAACPRRSRARPRAWRATRRRRAGSRRTSRGRSARGTTSAASRCSLVSSGRARRDRAGTPRSSARARGSRSGARGSGARSPTARRTTRRPSSASGAPRVLERAQLRDRLVVRRALLLRSAGAPRSARHASSEPDAEHEQRRSRSRAISSQARPADVGIELAGAALQLRVDRLRLAPARCRAGPRRSGAPAACSASSLPRVRARAVDHLEPQRRDPVRPLVGASSVYVCSCSWPPSGLRCGVAREPDDLEPAEPLIAGLLERRVDADARRRLDLEPHVDRIAERRLRPATP